MDEQEMHFGGNYILTLDMEKEIQMQELLIKGYQKENERLVKKNKDLTQKFEALKGTLYDQGLNIRNFKNKLI